jgi:alpha-amylase
MKKIKFVFCLHNHQPIGNFGWVFDRAYQDSYYPLIQIMSKHPNIKWCMHSSGMLWEYFTKERPEYIKLVKQMINSGSLEILSGGYYEPILPAIPDDDKIGQINKMNDYLMKKFNADHINGMWLAERVWEPHLAMPISKSGIKYTLLDDMAFELSGMNPDSLKGYYTTEEQGYPLNIFPISQKMRYMIPYYSPEDCIKYFKYESEKNSGDTVIVFADDGEKFGLWPESNSLVYKDGWLESFFTAIEQNPDIVETVTLSEVLKSQPPTGRVYLPCASYFEMTKWVLSVDMRNKFDQIVEKHKKEYGSSMFLHGGFWRNFLSKYEESNNMQKKMIHVSRKINEHKENNKPLVEEAFENLYAGQCNCAYWHGSFGGLYFKHLRNAVYNMLIRAENIYNESQIIVGRWTEKDINCDNLNEYIYEHKIQNIYIKRFGGCIYEWDIFGANVNLTDILTRRYETYHDVLKNNLNNLALLNSENNRDSSYNSKIKVREYGLEKHLVHDKYQRCSLIDHFFEGNIKQEDFAFVNYKEKGDFVCGQYSGEIKGNKITLNRSGLAYGLDFKVSKSIYPANDGYSVKYCVQNISQQATEAYFGCEQVFAFSALDEGDDIDLDSSNQWSRYDKYIGIGIEVKLSTNCRLFAHPIETVAYSEGVFEKIYQGTSLTALFKTSLQPNQSFEFSFEVKIKHRI